ncbi:AMP-binding protein [Kitasatospora sp. NBC_01250]|uniref:AMP-binding protein n=1 Tax=Kitasatospora sp. NBC_01250 TaxID=2903571 RepID=UPI002E2EA4D6|nr:AMP-binding protein [Kitasatospora sp. NBC_01250]
MPEPRTAAGTPPAAPPARLDDLLARAARRHGDRTAVRTDRGALSFTELDAAATRCAAAVQALVGSTGAVVALASPLDPLFAAAFHGIVRSGNVVAPVNPLLRAAELRHLLGTTRAALAIVTPAILAELEPVRGELPDLLDAVVLDGQWPDQEPAEVAAGGDIACLQFTSGTTGPPKAAVLTHRNLLVNAAQVAEAHRLGAGSVVLNHLPKYHLMHLNSALYAGATQVLCAESDPVEAVHAANRSGATHYYSIPMRLIRLAADERLPELRFDSTRMIASGGAALPSQAAEALRRHFGVPVFQGYGLAETSPLTHSDGPDRPRPGSVGPVVCDTECRIVELDTRRVLSAGEAGEVEVRGPQVMRGYLHGEPPLDAEGWLSTGDVGYTDEDGYLFLVDRIKDVFKCDNYLVSPTEVEKTLRGHPAVADCVVFDVPDPVSGAVAAAFVVLADVPADAAAGALDAVLAAANARLPYYQHVRAARAVDAIARSTNGKIQRRELREQFIARRETVPPRHGGAQVSESAQTIVAVTRFTVKAEPAEFEQAFKQHAEFMRSRPGFQRAQLVRSARSPEVYINIGWWDDRASYFAVLQSDEFKGHLGLFGQLADVEPQMGPVLLELEPGDA